MLVVVIRTRLVFGHVRELGGMVQALELSTSIGNQCQEMVIHSGYYDQTVRHFNEAVRVGSFIFCL